MTTAHSHRADNPADLTSDHSSGRVALARTVRSRLTDDDAQRLDDAGPAELVDLLGNAGLDSAAIIRFLAAENLDALTMSTLLPTIGLTIPDSIRVLHTLWEVPNTIAAELLDATVAEMRAAGCTAAEIIATRPAETLHELPPDPRAWELAAGSMATVGYSTDEIVDHLVAHAPTPEAFTLALLTVIESADALDIAARHQADSAALAAVSEAVGVSPADTANALRDATSTETMIEVLTTRCDGDTIAAAQLVAACGVDGNVVDNRVWRRPLGTGSTLDAEIAVLLDRLPPAGPSHVDDPIRALDTLALPNRPA